MNRRLVLVLAALLLVLAAALVLNQPGASGEPAPIARVPTSDVHALAFIGGPERVILGHHGGILESLDGGRTWTAWGAGSDAMAIGVAGEGDVIIAGHEVLAAGTRDGEWRDLANDLPHTDIHGFARDPGNPQLMWAYLATGGLYESRDGGARWETVFAGHTFGLLAVARDGVTQLLALDPEARGIVSSADGGRTWQVIGEPPTTPVYAMAAARDGDTILFSGGEGLFRSDDGGRQFASILDLTEPILAIAATPDGQTILIATRDRSIYRSDDGGRTWPASTP